MADEESHHRKRSPSLYKGGNKEVKIIIEILIKWAIPFVCAGLCSVMAALLRRSHSRNHSIAQGMQCLLRLEIIRSYENYSNKGHCPVYAREALSRGYAAYHALGGNDVATDLYDKIMELPTR